MAYNVDLEVMASQIQVHEEIRGFNSEQRLEAIPDPQAHDPMARPPLEKHDESIGQSAQRQAEIWYGDCEYFSDDIIIEGEIEIKNDPSLAESDNSESEDEEGLAKKCKAEDPGSDVECEEVEELVGTARTSANTTSTNT